MLQIISMNQHGMKNSHLLLDFLNLNKIQLMLHHISMSQLGTKNSHLQLDLLNLINKAHHFLTSQLLMIECQLEQVSHKQTQLMHHHISMNQLGMKNSHLQQDSINLNHLQRDQKASVSLLTMKECHHLLDLFNFQFVNLQTLKELHVHHQIKNYLLQE